MFPAHSQAHACVCVSRDCRWAHVASRTICRANLLAPVTIYRHHLPVSSAPPSPQRTSQGAAVGARTPKGVLLHTVAGRRQTGVSVGMEHA